MFNKNKYKKQAEYYEFDKDIKYEPVIKLNLRYRLADSDQN